MSRNWMLNSHKTSNQPQRDKKKTTKNPQDTKNTKIKQQKHRNFKQNNKILDTKTTQILRRETPRHPSTTQMHATTVLNVEKFQK